MAYIVRRNGVIVDAGESNSEFKARMQANRIKQRGLTKKEASRASKLGLTKNDIIRSYEQVASTGRPLSSLNSSEKARIVENATGVRTKPKGTVVVTKKNGEKVYRRIVRTRSGLVVEDVPYKLSNVVGSKNIYSYKDSSPSKPVYSGSGAKISSQDDFVKGKLTVAQSLDKAKTNQLDSMRGKGVLERTFRGTVVLGTIGAIRGLNDFRNVVFHPVKSGKDFVALANLIRKDPSLLKVIATDEFNRFAVDPVGVVAEYYSFGGAMSKSAKFAKRSSVGRFVSEELYIAKQPVEIRPAVRSIIKSSKVQEKINPFNLKDIKKVDFAEVKSLTKTDAKALAKTLKETDSVVFGSLASRTLSKKKTPIPKDVDLATKSITEFNKKFMDNLPKNVRKNYKINGEKIYRKTAGRYESILDVKPLKRLYPDKSILTKKGFLPVSSYVKKFKVKSTGLPYGAKLKSFRKVQVAGLEIPTQKIVDVGGIKLVGFGEQTTRKGLGTIEVLIRRDVKRAKDPQSFIRSLQVQIEGLKKSRPKTALGRLRKASRIKNLNNALKILTSKGFVRLLERKVKGLTKEFPLLEKIDVKKLKASKKLGGDEVNRLVSKKGGESVTSQKKRIVNLEANLKRLEAKKVKGVKTKNDIKRLRVQIQRRKADLSLSKGEKVKVKKRGVSVKKGKKVVSTKKKVSAKKTTSRLRRRSRSRLPPNKASKSLLAKKGRSSTPSRLSKRRASKTPSKTPSKKPSKLPSRIPSKKPSRLPSRIPSKFPSRFPTSKVPSRIPSRIPSKLRSRIPIAKRSLPPAKNKLLRKLQDSKTFKKRYLKEVYSVPESYRPSFEAVVLDIVATKKPRTITGLEVRPIIVKLAKKKRTKRLKKQKR